MIFVTHHRCSSSQHTKPSPAHYIQFIFDNEASHKNKCKAKAEKKAKKKEEKNVQAHDGINGSESIFYLTQYITEPFNIRRYFMAVKGIEITACDSFSVRHVSIDPKQNYSKHFLFFFFVLLCSRIRFEILLIASVTSAFFTSLFDICHNAQKQNTQKKMSQKKPETRLNSGKYRFGSRYDKMT